MAASPGTMELGPSESAEDLREKLMKLSSHYQNLLQETHTKALVENEIQTKRWEDYKKDHVELKDRLLSLRDKLSHTIMVPIGKKALMRGQLVHTNEIMVCLGDGWFAKLTAKQASDICHRRIQHCDEMLKKLKKEEELLNARRTFPFESEAFCGDSETQEIIEAYNEEEEKLWKEKHRQKEKEYRQKLAELRKAPKNKIETEEDLWQRLDALDMQEELEDELNRMDEDIEDEEEDDEDSEDDSDSDDETFEEKEQVEKKKLQRRVSFREEKDNSESGPKSDNSDDNAIRIVFKHSDTPVSVPLVSSDEILTPSEIYVQYLKRKTPKSILKPSPSVDHPPVEVEELISHAMTESNVKISLPSLPVEPAVKAISEEVVERTPASTAAATVHRPVSRFKAARMASKR